MWRQVFNLPRARTGKLKTCRHFRELSHDHAGVTEGIPMHEPHGQPAADGGIRRRLDPNSSYLSQFNAFQPDGRFRAALDSQRKDARDNGNIADLKPVIHLTAAPKLPIANSQ